MLLTEPEVQARFISYLNDRGWDVAETDPGDYTDVVSRRGAQWLAAECKGHTKSPETAVDIGYGQLLRAMGRYPEASYALVVPETLRGKVVRVPEAVRRKLGITVYLVPAVSRIDTV
jgi:hypothetical protein